MKHRRAGPQKAPAGPPCRSPVVNKIVVRKEPPARKTPPSRGTVPKPIGPWAAMRELLASAGISSPVLFDVGAHFGNVTELLLKMWPLAEVHCFEPEPLGLETLHKKFDGDDRVVIVPSALGSRQGTAKFHVCGQGTEMSSLLPRGEHLGRRYYRHEVREIIEVPVTTLDAYCEELGIEDVHLMKMDVQGGEKLVLRGGRLSLAAGGIWAIYSEILFVELYKGAALFWELCKILDKHDITVFDIYGLQRSWVNRQLKYGDALWIGPELRTRANDYPEEWLRKSLEYRMCPGR